MGPRLQGRIEGLAESELTLSRILDALREAKRVQPPPPFEKSRELCSESRPFRVLTVTSNKGGVGKTTVAANLAVYLRALREDLPILLLGLDEQPLIDRMFAIGPPVAAPTVAGALRKGSLVSAVRLGQYGVHYVPSSPSISELKLEIADVFHLHKALLKTCWHGLVIIDTKSDFEILTHNAIAASDLSIVVVKDQASLHEAGKVFELLDRWGNGSDRARVLLSLMDLRVKYGDEERCDILALLLSEIRRRSYPHFPTFISRSPKIESLYTNPCGSAHSILHGAPGSIVHRQMRRLANDVLEFLGGLETSVGELEARAPVGPDGWRDTRPAAFAVSQR
jgi:cellulose biosynthesis protein BcsQ